MTKFFKVFKVKIMNFDNLIQRLPKTEKEVKKYFVTNSNITFIEDINNTDFLLFEAVSKEQKEAGQREMWKLTNNVIYKLERYFEKKWSNPKNLKNKKIEKERLEEYKKYFNKYEPSEKTIKFYKDKMGSKPNFPISTIEKEDSKSPAGFYPYNLQTLFVSNFDVKHISEKDKYLNGFDFTEKQAKENENIIWKFIIMHEQGHLFEYLKNLIETGTIRQVSTADFQFSQKDKQNVNDSEAGANAYAIDNMYRKDRRELLKNSSFEKTDKLDRLKDAYKKDLDKKSKTFEKTRKSIEKEKSYFDY